MGFLARLLGKEKRSGLRSPADWLYRSFVGGGRTVSGESVSPTTALTLSSYYAAIRAISEDVAKLPLILYRRMKPRGKTRLPTHPLFRLLHDEPNRDMSSMSFRETMTLHAIGWGNGIAEIVRDKSLRPVALWPLDPSRVSIERDDQQRLIYRIHPGADSQEVVLQSMDVLHLHGLGFDGTTGFSVAHLAREGIGAALAAQKHGAALFGNGAMPGGFLEHPGTMADEDHDAFRAEWEESHRGVDKAHKIAILEQGMKFSPATLPNKDSQWIEARKFSVNELCRWLRVPPHKVCDLERATFSNIEQQSIEYVVDTLQPWLVRWEQEIARKLITPRSGLFAEHLVDGLLRGDTEARYGAYRTGILSGFLSRNEVRELENRNPIDGLDEYLEPSNTIAAGERERAE